MVYAFKKLNNMAIVIEYTLNRSIEPTVIFESISVCEIRHNSSYTALKACVKLGYIMGNQSVLSSGFPISNTVENLSIFGELISEASSIFKEKSMTLEMLKELGYELNEKLLIRN